MLLLKSLVHRWFTAMAAVLVAPPANEWYYVEFWGRIGNFLDDYVSYEFTDYFGFHKMRMIKIRIIYVFIQRHTICVNISDTCQTAITNSLRNFFLWHHWKQTWRVFSAEGSTKSKPGLRGLGHIFAPFGSFSSRSSSTYCVDLSVLEKTSPTVSRTPIEANEFIGRWSTQSIIAFLACIDEHIF